MTTPYQPESTTVTMHATVPVQGRPESAQPSKAHSIDEAEALAMPRAEITDLQDVWLDARVVAVGYRAMLQNISRYLPKLPRERGTAYMRRVQHTSFTNMFGRAVGGIASLPFRRPLTITDVHPTVRDHFECLDADDTALPVFLRRLFYDGMLTGTAGILVEMPAVNRVLSAGQEERLGIRPRWHHVRAENLHRWRFATVNGRQQLVMLALRFEEEDEATGFEFVESRVVRIYVYRLRMTGDGLMVTAQRYREVPHPKHKDRVIAMPEEEERVLNNLTRIPYAPLRIGYFTSQLTALSSLVDVLDLNLMHFRIASDRNWLMHLGCMPIPVRIGDTVMPSAPIGAPATGSNDPATAASTAALLRRTRNSEEWGTHVMMRVPKEGDFKFAEITGAAFEPTGKELQDIKASIAALSLAFLAPDRRIAETAEANRLDAAVQNANITSAAMALDDCASLAASFHAEFLKLAKVGAGGALSGGVIATSKEFELAALTSELGNLYAQMEQNRQISLETFWQILERFGGLPSDFSPEQERKRLLGEANVRVIDEPPPLTDTDTPDDTDDDEPGESGARNAPLATGATGAPADNAGNGPPPANA